jgi:SHS2 domain-containing protein
MDYELIENITHADVAVRVKGSSYDEIFVKGANALMREMVENPGDIERVVVKEGAISGENPELIYFEFLNEILFFKDAEGILLLPESVELKETAEGFTCSFRLSGEKIIRGKHLFRVDVKAVTMHGLKIYVDNGVYTAESVFDV